MSILSVDGKDAISEGMQKERRRRLIDAWKRSVRPVAWRSLLRFTS